MMAVDQIARMMALDAAQSGGGGGDSYTKAETDELLDGKADLENGKVPAAQLPSYVDDVAEYASTSAFPATGESGKIYIATDTNKTYRWGGSAYVEISESLALGETASTAYAGNKGKANADAIAAIKDGTNIDSFADVETALANIPHVTVDQTYNAQSANAQSGTAVAEAIGSIPAEVKRIFSQDFALTWGTTESQLLEWFASNIEIEAGKLYLVIITTSGDKSVFLSTIMPCNTVGTSVIAGSGFIPVVVGSKSGCTVGKATIILYKGSGVRLIMDLPPAPSGYSINNQSSTLEIYEIQRLLINDSISADDYATQTTGGTVKAWTTTDGSDTILHLATQ